MHKQMLYYWAKSPAWDFPTSFITYHYLDFHKNGFCAFSALFESYTKSGTDMLWSFYFVLNRL
jgi:hypothetical protein